MAKVKKDTKKPKNQKTKKLESWLENKIALARTVSKHRAARAVARYGAPAGVALLAFIVLYSLFLPKDQFQLAKERLVKNPNDLEAHLILAEEFLKNNQLDEAEKELLIADSLHSTVSKELAKESGEQILGAAISKLHQLWQRKRGSKPEDIKELIEKWEEIVSEKPDYRDGYLQLALLHYKLYENEKAKEYLEKALELDPNFEPARELEKVIR